MVKELMDNGGKLSMMGTENEKCVLTVHPKIGLKACRT